MRKADSVVREDNEDVRITEWRLAPGAVSPQARQAYFRKAGVEHDVVNVGKAPYAFTEIELKRQPG